jgi:hypothetical protein
VGFKSLQENIDTTTSGGKLVFHIFGALELARIGPLRFIFVDSPTDKIGSSSPVDTFATRLSAQPLR